MPVVITGPSTGASVNSDFEAKGSSSAQPVVVLKRAGQPNIAGVVTFTNGKWSASFTGVPPGTGYSLVATQGTDEAIHENITVVMSAPPPVDPPVEPPVGPPPA